MYFFLALSQAPVQDIDFGMMLLRMLFFLALIVVFIYFLLRKVLPLLVQSQGFHRTVRVIERVPVDQKRALLVVEVQGKYLLLGSSEGQINVLMELDKDQMNVRPETVKSVSFEQILKKTFLKPKKMEDRG